MSFSNAFNMKREHNPVNHKENESSGRKKAKHSKASNNDLLLLNEILLVVIHQGLLSWNDMVMVSSTSKKYQVAFKEELERALEPVLHQLENMSGFNTHSYCGKVFSPLSQRVCSCLCKDDLSYYDNPHNQTLVSQDPRYQNQIYDDLSNAEKCQQMVNFIARIVANLRQIIPFDNPTTEVVQGVGTANNWGLGDGLPQDLIFHFYTNRSNMALNLVIVSHMQGIIGSGDCYDYEDAVMGRGPVSPGGSSFGVCVADCVAGLCPFGNQNLVSYMRQCIYPSKQGMDMLGPILTSKLFVGAPWFALVPPGEGSHNLATLDLEPERLFQIGREESDSDDEAYLFLIHSHLHHLGQLDDMESEDEE